MKNKNQGFTLIELLIVIGIIAILAAAVIVSINPGQQFVQARNATRRNHMNTIATAVYSYVVENDGQYPECEDDVLDSADFIDVALCTELTPDHISSIPDDPEESANYQIKLTGDGSIELESSSDEWSGEDNIVQ